MTKLETLKKIATGTEANGFDMVSPSDENVIALMADAEVEVNPDVKDEAGNIAARITEKGKAALLAVPAPGLLFVEEKATESKAKAEKPVFTVLGGLEVPTVENKLRQRGEVYPFSKLQIGESFHVAATEAKPNPAKTLTAAVASAQRRFKDASNNFTRKFVVRKVKAGQKYSNGFVETSDGARIFRIPVETKEAAAE